MTRSRWVLFVAMTVVVVGVVAGAGAIWMSSARAAVGPLAGEALILPKDARFVMGFDVKRFTASPFYAKFAAGARHEARGARAARGADGPQPGARHRPDRDRGLGAGPEGLSRARRRFRTLRSLQARPRHRDGRQGAGLEPRGRHGLHLRGRRDTPLAVAFLDESTARLRPAATRCSPAITSRTRNETPLKGNTALMALVEKVRPGSTFWMVGDQSLLASLPTSIPAPGASADGSASMTLPALKGLTVTGDLDPQVSLAITGDATDEPRPRTSRTWCAASWRWRACRRSRSRSCSSWPRRSASRRRRTGCW